MRDRDQGPKLKRRDDELGDAFPNDYLEALILFVVGIGIFGGLFSLYYLTQQL